MTDRPPHPLSPEDARFRTMADCAPVLLWMTGADGLCSYFNQGWLEFTGRTMEQELGVGWAEGVHPEDFQQTMDAYWEAFVARREFRLEYRLRRADGAYRWILDHGRPYHQAGGTFLGFIGSCIDFTDLKLAQETMAASNRRLTAALRDREVLLREVYHRVKNNLQVVRSMLRLQARHIELPEVRALFEDAENRVYSMALVHERLYRAPEASAIDLGEHAREIAVGLQMSLPPLPVVQVEIEAEPIFAPLEIAVPVGLVLTELISNSFRHAFAGRDRGSVRVALVRDGDLIRLRVHDDGVGLPPAIRGQTGGGFGLELVRTMAEQLEGELKIESSDGARFELCFAKGA
jgi:PAS domain S-box-containing protein